MADAKQKKPWYKRWWAISLFIIIGLAIIGNIFGGNNSSSTSFNSGGILSSGNSGNCPKELVPERVKLECADYLIAAPNITKLMCNYLGWKNPKADKFNNPQGEPAIKYYWKDGTEMPASNLQFWKAEKQGENVNYMYSVSYEIFDKTPINSDGTIGKQISYGMFFAIDPNDNNADGYKIVEYKCTKAYSEWVKI